MSLSSRVARWMGHVAAPLEGHPRIWSFLKSAHRVMTRLLDRIGIRLPRHTPKGLQELKSLLESGTQIQSSNENHPLVVVISPRAWATHLFTDTIFATALGLRNTRVAIWTCGLAMPVCHITNSSEAPPMPCGNCQKMQGELLDNGPLKRIRTSDYVNANEVAALRREIDKLDVGELSAWRPRHVNIGAIATIATNWFLRTANYLASINGEGTMRNFMLLGAVSELALQRFITERRPDLFVMLNGQFTEENVVREIAQAKGIPYVTYERSFGRNSYLFARNSLANHYDLSAHWEKFKDMPLGKDQNDELDRFLAKWRSGLASIVSYWKNPEENHAVIRRELSITENEPVYLLFTNVVWDTAAFNRDVAFGSMWEWIQATIRHVASKPVRLIIRIHPGEVRLPGRESLDRVVDRIAHAFPTLPANVSVVPADNEISSYRLIDIAEKVLVYTSTVGLEAALCGKAVMVLGDTHYRGKGFTIDPDTPESYFELLDAAPTATIEGTRRIETLARRYAYLFFHRYPISLPAIAEKRMGNPHLAVSSVDELRPGEMPELDLICRFFRESLEDLQPKTLILR